MSRSRQRRRAGKERRHKAPQAIVREATHVERLAYTRTQAAEALGISRSTFDRRVLPYIDTIEMPWGTRLIPADELERFLAERTEEPRMPRSAATRSGRRSSLPSEVVARISRERAQGSTLADIARRLNRAGIPTSQGGRQWWSSTVRSILLRSERRSAQAVGAKWPGTP